MLSRTDQQRRAKYEEVLGLIGSLGEFTKEEIQQQCREARPAFVTAVLKQLMQDGMLETIRADAGPRRLNSGVTRPCASLRVTGNDFFLSS